MNLVGASATSDLDGLLARSPIAMLLADDQRRYVDVNEAACTLLGLSRAELLEAGVDRLTPVALRGSVPALWERFLSQGAMQGVYELTDASGRLIRVTYVAVARVLPGLHLSCLLTGRARGCGRPRCSSVPAPRGRPRRVAWRERSGRSGRAADTSARASRMVAARGCA